MKANAFSYGWSIDEMSSKLTPSRDVVYKKIGERELHLYFFDPGNFNVSDKRVCFLSIHGGGWTGMSPHRQYPFASYFAERGMVAISVEYRLANEASGTTVLDCARDVRSAVRYVRKHAAELGVDPQKIVVNGGSAGGHLAAGTAFFDGIDESTEDTTGSCVPNALVLYSPAIDTSDEGCGRALCGEKWKEISPLHRVKAGAPPTIVFHGTMDPVTPFKGTELFYNAMRQMGNHCELVAKEGAGHSYMYLDQTFYEETLQETEAFLAAQKLLPIPRPGVKTGQKFADIERSSVRENPSS